MGRRATTDLCLVVGVDKPAGMTSHDVVARCRRIYGERRIGHTGTLDPAATGALAVCVGPAARLDRFLTGHDKVYEFSIVFGVATDTDDAQGEVEGVLPVPPEVGDAAFAQRTVAGLAGALMQMPPVYSAVRVNGKRAHAEARKGNVIELKPRAVEIYEAELVSCEAGDFGPVWTVRAHVSSGTYVRSIARDLGRALGTFAHVGSLRRLRAGLLDVGACVSLAGLEADPFGAVLDPVRLLGLRILFADHAAAAVESGRSLPAEGVALHAYRPGERFECTSGLAAAPGPLGPAEQVSVVVRNELKAVYAHDAERSRLVPECVFSKGVRRGLDIRG